MNIYIYIDILILDNLNWINLYIHMNYKNNNK